jgi:predicted membrane channel-forming protein YqfA (hemolysin III family)
VLWLLFQNLTIWVKYKMKNRNLKKKTKSFVFLGINILIFGSMVPVIHYAFYCYLKLKAIYIGVLLVLSIASIIGTSSAACAKPQCRPFKAILFIALGLYGMMKLNFYFK